MFGRLKPLRDARHRIGRDPAAIDDRGARDESLLRQMRTQLALGALVAAVVGACASGAQSPQASTAGPQAVTAHVVAAEPLNPDASDLALSGIDAETAQRYVDVAVNDPWVRKALGSDRADPVEVADYGDGKSGIAVFVYDYTTSKALRIGFDATGMEIVQRSESPEQPSFSPREIARAGELVAASDLVTKKSAGTKYQVWNVTGAHSGAFDGHRVLAVFLAPEGKSADDLLIAFADLSVDAVVEVDDASIY